MLLDANVEGDGKTKSTALFLKSAVMRKDHIAFQYLWMAKNGAKSLKQMLKPGEDGFMYDVHVTEKGMVWFKIPAIRINLSMSTIDKFSGMSV